MTTGNTHVISLNGNPYVVRLPVREYAVEQQSPAFRTTGAFTRINNPKAEPYAFNDWSRGFGTRSVRPGHPEDFRGFFDATVMTVWKQAITLPITDTALDETTITGIGGAGMLQGSAQFSGSLYALFMDDNWNDNDGGAGSVIACALSGTNWGAGNVVVTEPGGLAGVGCLDLIAADKLYALCTTGQSNAGGHLHNHVIRYSTDGATWTAPATAVITFGLGGTSQAVDDGKLAFDGARVVAVIYNRASSRVETWWSTDRGDTWNETTGLRFNSEGGVTGAIAYLDTDDTTVIYVATPTVLKILDIAAATQSDLLPLNGNTHSGKRLAVHNGSLYVPIDNGNNAPFAMKKITVRDGVRIIDDVGLDVTQGVPSSMFGPILYMKSIGPNLVVAVGGGAASRNARLLTLSGLPDEGWQNLYHYSTENDPITWVDFIGTDVCFQQGGITDITDRGDTRMLPDALSPPNSGVTFTYTTPADLELPEFGGDALAESGGFLQVQADAEDLVDGAEVLDFEYGLNGATATTAGPTLDDTNRKQGLGTSNRGLSARTIKVNLEFNRGGTTGNTPKLREFLLLFRKLPAGLHGWEVEIDLEETARQFPRRGIAVLLSELNTVETSNTLVPFQLANDDTERQVEMVAPAYGWWLEGRQGGQSYAYRAGIMQIKIEEVVG